MENFNKIWKTKGGSSETPLKLAHPIEPPIGCRDYFQQSCLSYKRRFGL